MVKKEDNVKETPDAKPSDKPREKEKRVKKLLEKVSSKTASSKGSKEKKFAPKKMNKDPFDILNYVLMTEKSVQLIESQNKLVFVINKKFSKKDVKDAAENAFQTKVNSVRVLHDQKGRKKAFIKFDKEGIAGDIAIRLGII